MRLFNKFKELRNKKRFNAIAAQVVHTKPIKADKSAKVVILSQVYHDAVHMALLALKSFAYQLGDCEFEIVDDGSLTEEDKQLFHEHLSDVTITHLADIDVGKCPRGGTWERLVRILQLSRERYVVQVDTDTLTISAIPEIVKAIAENRAFTIGNPIFSFPVPADYMVKIATKWQGNHVQVETERCLTTLTSANFKHYCRGCSALTGFPVMGPGFEQLESLSWELQQRLGSEKWNEWGSEQVASNLLVSLTDDPLILPWPKYANYGFPSTGTGNNKPENYIGKASTLHFIGSHRFSSRVYEKLSALVMEQALGKVHD